MAMLITEGRLSPEPTVLSRGMSGAQSISLLMTNVSENDTETVIVTLTDASGTKVPRRIVRAVLGPNEQLSVTSIPLSKEDLVQAYTTNADKVDFVTATCGIEMPFQVTVLTADGLPKK